MHVDIRLLGGFEVVVDGERRAEDAWRRRQAAALVKLLALARDQRLLREQVIDALWPELLVEQAAPRLHKAAHYARAALDARDGVVLAGETVSLFPRATVEVDVRRFDRAAEAALSDGDERRAAEAVDLYRGDLLPEDVYEPWTQEAREARRLRYLQLLRELGRWEQVIAAEPADELAHLRLVEGHLARGDRASALGGLDRMERIWQRELGAELSATAVELRDRALALPVVASSGGVQRRAAALAAVPLPTTPTVGRARDIAGVLEVLEHSRVVTLLGPGGVGKTRLAIEVALRYSQANSVDACFVDLTKVDNAALVPELVARELGIHLGPRSAAEPVLQEALRGRSLLLVIDNFEHVVDAARLVGDLVRWSPDVRVLCTSRARLHVTGERVVDVAPLRLEPDDVSAARTNRPADAVALFDQVATAVDPSFRLDADYDTVDRICRALDGLPLAIELAAGHVRTLPPSLLLSRLGARLGSPTGAARDMPPRQHTIAATIDWSLQLLRAAEQRLFARLGVFAGAVPLEAVERICAEPGEDVVDALSRLVDQSLVRRVDGRDGEPRFVLLDLLRERARELLGADGTAEVGARHATYVLEVLGDLDERQWTDAAHRWIDDINAWLAEVRSAHGWARQCGDAQLAARITACLGTYWHREGHHAEGRRWVADALAHEAALDAHLVARLHLVAGLVEWTRDVLTAREHWSESVRRYRAVGDDRYLAYSLAMVAGTYLLDPDGYEVAMRLVDEGIALARRVGERPLTAQALNVKGELARVHGNDALAGAAYEEGRDLAAAAGDAAHLSMFLGNLGYLAVHRGDHDEALRLGRDALRLSWSLGRRMMTAWLVSELAGPELGLGRPQRGALLVGAADHAFAILGVDRHPGDLPEHDRVLAGLREALGEKRFELHYAEGGRLSLDEAVTVALADG